MDPHQILDIYFKDHFYPFTKHHIDSYREFLRRYIPDVIRSYNPITMVKFRNNNEKDVELKVDLFVGGESGNSIYIDRPTIIDKDGNPIILTPQDARLKNLTYSARLYGDIMIRYTIAGKEKPIEKHFSHILLGEIPLMVHSDGCILHRQGPKVLQSFNECPYDQGGYFIIDGKEKVVISQERMVTNRLFIEKAKDPRFSYKGWVRCTTESGEAALLPKTVEFYILNPDVAAQPLPIDEDEDEEETSPKMKTSFLYRGAILVALPNIRDPNKNQFKIPLFQLFRAFGVESDKEILETIFGNVATLPQEYIDFIMPSIRHCANDAKPIFSQQDAIEDLKNYVRFKSNEHVHSILTQDIFPNMGDDYTMKARFLGYLIKYMMEMILKVRPVADRDGYGFKRVDLSGFLLSQLFHNIYKRFRKHCRDLLDQEYHYGPTRNTGHYEDLVRKENIQKIISPYFITERMVRSLKGLWGSSDQDEKQEKVQDLARISYIGFMSNLRRVNTPLDRSIKITSPHRLNAQQWGIICPFESPDGASIGYLKNFALLAHVSFGTDPEDLIREPHHCLRELEMIPLEKLTGSAANELTKVFLNGKWVGCHTNPDVFTHRLRLLRRNGLINVFISVSWKIHMNEIRIQTDPGRACRPLLIAHREPMELNDKVSWFDLVFGSLLPKGEKVEDLYYISSYKSPTTLFGDLTTDEIYQRLEKTQAHIEFLDIEEEDTRLIAMKPEDVNAFTTHIEIHPSTILSVVSTNIPLANHNQAPRNIFYGAQSKQAIGVYATNFSKRFDTMSYIMHYPQKPIITTQNSHYISNDKLPCGFNTIVAIMTNTGYNQEDGIIVNKTSVDRGMFQITSYKSYSAQETSTNKNQYTMFANPLKMKKDLRIEIDNLKEDANYQLLDDNGIVIPESFVTKGSKLSIIGMVEVKEQLKEIRKGLKIETKMVKSYRNASVVTGVHHYGTVDKVYVDSTGSLNEHNRVCKIRFRKIRRPELGDKTCLTPDHEVLTDKGWKFINNITIKDKVYVLKEDGSFDYEYPIDTYEVDCKDTTLYKLNSQQVDLCVTLDHNMWIRKRNKKHYEIVKAKDIIGKRVSYAKSAINMNPDYQLIIPCSGKCPELKLNMDIFLEFFGFWISDGWASITKRNRPGRKSESIDYNVEICQVKPDDRKRLEELVRLLGFSPTSHNDKIKIASRQLAEFLHPLSVGAPNKYLPDWVWLLSERQCKLLYEGLRRGDGSVHCISGSDSYYTSSKKLANDVQRLALHAGWSANITTIRAAGHKTVLKDGRCITSNYDSLSVNIVKTKNNPTINHGHVKTQTGQSESLITYTGKVYCIEVPSHVFYVRHNGKPVWTGNCSRHGQKGVVGMLLPEEDMPFTKDGIVPDIIINPHAIPSRMTIGHLVECVFAKLCTMEGMTGDGSVFIPLDLEKIGQGLEEHEFEKYGNEILYNGRTGDQIATEIFMGPTFYLRLKHMVADKVHSRDKGPKDQLTRQPTSGRGKEGGLRIGEMERDVLLSYGFSQFLKESVMERSDQFTWAICKQCGRIARYAPKQDLYECMGCSSTDISVVQTPYAFKLLVQELETMGITPRFVMDTETIHESELEEEAPLEFEPVEEEEEEIMGGADDVVEDVKGDEEGEKEIDDTGDDQPEIIDEDDDKQDDDQDDDDQDDDDQDEGEQDGGEDEVELITEFSEPESEPKQEGGDDIKEEEENTKKVISINDDIWNKKGNNNLGNDEEEEFD